MAPDEPPEGRDPLPEGRDELPDGRDAPPEGRDELLDGRDDPTDERELDPDDRVLPTDVLGAVVPDGLRRTEDGEPTDLGAATDGERAPDGVLPVATGGRLSTDEPVGGTMTGREVVPTRPEEVRGATGGRAAPSLSVLDGALGDVEPPNTVGR